MRQPPYGLGRIAGKDALENLSGLDSPVSVSLEQS